MTDNDRYTDPKDAGWHAVQALTILGLSALAVWLAVRFAMGLHPEMIAYLIGLAWCFTPLWLYIAACLARPIYEGVLKWA